MIAASAAAPAATDATAAARRSDADSTTALEEVLVTAEKRERNLQRTPAAVTALGSEQLVAAGVRDLRGAQALVPSVRFQSEGNTTQVFVRGVGSGLDLAPIEPTVSVHFDGVQMPREGTSAALFDLERIEVLPGPQGTLYGRSAIGGVVNVLFRRPQHDAATELLLEAGSDALLRAGVARNFDASERLALRAAVDYTRRDGFNATGADSQDDTALRLSALLEPREGVSAWLWASGARKAGRPPNLVNKGTDPATFAYSPDAFLTRDPWDDRRLGALAPTAPFGQPQAGEQRYETLALGGEIGVQLVDGVAALTWIPSYVYLDSASDYWLGAIPAFISQRYNLMSQELRLAGTSGRWQWLGGAYGYSQRNVGYFAVARVFVNSDVRGNLLQGLGAFGEGTYALSSAWRLTLGGRYSADRREADGFQTANPATLVPLGPFSFRRNYSKFDWKAGLEFDLAPSTMLYATLQTGSSPGTYNSAPATPSFDNAVQPADLAAITLGFKSRPVADTLQLNLEAFYYRYSDLIIQQYNQNVSFNPVFNAQDVRIYGGQLDLLWRPTRADRLQLALGYTHARNREFTTPAGDRYDGLAPPYAPDWTAVGRYGHDFALAGGAVLRAELAGRYESAWWADYVHNPGTRQAPSFKGDASLTYESARGWSLGAWMRNIGNEAVLAATAAGGIPGPATAYLEPPRSYGVRLTARF
ncbi:MAG: TonB-dependent receptor [Steroidobacteraceae bacterium]